MGFNCVCFVVVSGEQRAVEGEEEEEEDCGPSWDRDAEDSLGIYPCTLLYYFKIDVPS